MSDAAKLGYSEEGDVVTLRMTRDDYGNLLLLFGYGAAAANDRRNSFRFLSLANRLLDGSPSFTPFVIPEIHVAETAS